MHLTMKMLSLEALPSGNRSAAWHGKTFLLLLLVIFGVIQGMVLAGDVEHCMSFALQDGQAFCGRISRGFQSQLRVDGLLRSSIRRKVRERRGGPIRKIQRLSQRRSQGPRRLLSCWRSLRRTWTAATSTNTTSRWSSPDSQSSTNWAS